MPVNPEQAVVVAAVAAAISALTALSSLAALLVSIWIQWRANRPRVEVLGAISTLVSATTIGMPRFSIEVRNIGTIPMVVTSVGIAFRDGTLSVLPTARTLLDEYVLPRKVEAGEGVTLTNELAPIVDAHRERRLRAFGRVWRLVSSAAARTRPSWGPLN